MCWKALKIEEGQPRHGSEEQNWNREESKERGGIFFIIIIFRIVMSKLQYYLNIFSTVMYHSIVII